MRFLHAADIHLDSPMRGLERYESAPHERLRAATRAALANLVEFAREEEVDFVVIAGDLFDGSWRDYNTGLFFNKEMGRLAEANIPVFLVSGNHDAQSQLSRHLRPPDNVHVFSPRRPETRLLEHVGVAIHGQGYRRAAVTDNLAENYPSPVADHFNVGVLHTALDGREGHAPYAPCAVADLIAKGYDYWALGHVHSKEVVRQTPWVAFSGNLQGRSVRETGEKGCLLVADDQDGGVTVDFCPLDVVRWEVLQVDAEDAVDGDDIVERSREALVEARDAADGRLLAARIQVSGASRAHRALATSPERWLNEVRSVANGLGDVWVEKVQFRTRLSLDLGDIEARDDALGEFVRALRDGEHADLSGVMDGLKDLRAKLPPELVRGPDAVTALSALDEATVPGSVQSEVLDLLLARLLSKGGE